MFEMEFGVRDYELDYEGIVNNAVYLHYLEHTRHCFSRQCGVDFAALHREGIDPVLSRAEIDYRCPLRSGDTVVSRLSLVREGARFVFRQQINRKSDGNLVVTARIVVACLENGRLSRGDRMAAAFAPAITL